ncbi:MAG: DUF5681 domain-containing protein [Bacteroidales bacterium]|jgi:hypothetical protein
MAFVKGQSGNPAGRPKGSKNKVTKDVKEWLLELFYNHASTLDIDLKAMTPRERWDVITKILPFIVPRLQAMQAKIDLNNLSDDQLKTIIEAIKEEL